MSCIKGKQNSKPVKGNYRCQKCGGCSSQKKDLCKPEKIKKATNSQIDEKARKKKKGKKK